MKICVVTPYYQEPLDWIVQAHASVRSQTIEARHILVADGAQPAQIPDFQGTHIILERNYRDYGHTPRFIGAFNAVTAHDADAIAFLDADNWFYPDHLGSLTAIAANAGLHAVASARMLHRLDGTPMMKCPTVDGANYVDTSCIIVLRPAFRHLIAWVLRGQEKAAETDQFFWRLLRDSGVPLAFVDRPSVAYRTRHQVHYNMAQEPLPPASVHRVDLHGDRYQ
jgi:glycosyltransferase involved in cell wall biosynthesis